jgi:hypothetical protein
VEAPLRITWPLVFSLTRREQTAAPEIPARRAPSASLVSLGNVVDLLPPVSGPENYLMTDRSRPPQTSALPHIARIDVIPAGWERAR